MNRVAHLSSSLRAYAFCIIFAASIAPAVAEQAGKTEGEPDPSLYAVTYQYQRIADGFLIDYRLPYLDLLRAGGPIAGVRYEVSPFISPFPRVRATLANNSDRQMIVRSVVLDIKASELKREVVLTVDYGSTNTLVLVNHGWADVDDAKLVFSIEDRAKRGAPSVPSKPNEVSLGTFGASKVVSIVKYVPSEFASSDFVDVSGEVQYGSPPERRTVKFKTTVKLVTQAGKPLPPTETYDLFFRAGKTGRVVADLPVAHQIKPGDAEAMDFRISTDRSSLTTLKMSFLTADGDELPAESLTLDLFVPRFLGLQLDRSAKPEP